MSATISYRQRSGVWIPWALGLLLLAAAGLKVEQFVVETTINDDLLSSRPVLIALIECELLLGFWLLSGWSPHQCRTVAMAAFTLFAAVSCYKAVIGAASCGCFGRVSINPWVTLVLDVLALVGLRYWQPANATNVGYDTSRLATAGVLIVLVGGTSAYYMVNAEATRLNDEGTIVNEKELVILEPEKWINQPLPILQHLEIDEPINRGSWVILLYHHDCPKCLDAKPKYQELAERHRHTGSDTRVALVEVPPHQAPLISTDNAAAYVRGRLRDDRPWFVQTPVEIQLQDNIVVLASTELPFLTHGSGADE